jgi:transposase
MSKKTFTEKEIKSLSKNPYVNSVSSKGITYTEEFRRHFIAENEKGKLPREIFEYCGFDVEVLGIARIESAAKRWRAAYREDGIEGLKDTRKENSGRPREGELSLEEKYARLEAQVNLLKAENELLKKIDLAERRLKGKK